MNPVFESELKARGFINACLMFSDKALAWTYNGTDTWWGKFPAEGAYSRVMFLGVIP